MSAEEPLRTEREKMLAGALYDASDPELVRGRRRARELLHLLQVTRPTDHEARREVLRQLFGRGGEHVSLEPPFFCDYGSNIELGEHVFFNFNCTVLDVCKVVIGDHCQFGCGVQVLTPLHPFDAALRRVQEYGAPVTIGADVWVGSGALILPGVTVGARTVVGAGSVVTRSLPPDVLAVGNPCRVVRAIG